jgi:hypothetical protein
MTKDLICTCKGTAHETASSSGYTPDPNCLVHRSSKEVSGPPFTIGRYDSLGACVTAERDYLRTLLRDWLKGCPNPPEWHWSFDLNIRSVHALDECSAQNGTEQLWLT